MPAVIFFASLDFGKNGYSRTTSYNRFNFLSHFLKGSFRSMSALCQVKISTLEILNKSILKKGFPPFISNRIKPQSKFTLSSLSSSRGFTLIETLVAVMVLAISLVTIMQLFSGGLKSSMVSDSYTLAIFHAREKMEEILLLDELVEGDLEGNFRDSFSWKSKISLFKPEEDDEESEVSFDMFNVEVQVFWKKGYHARHVDLKTVRIAKKFEKET
jgi:general secretion pathway protein I